MHRYDPWTSMLQQTTISSTQNSIYLRIEWSVTDTTLFFSSATTLGKYHRQSLYHCLRCRHHYAPYSRDLKLKGTQHGMSTSRSPSRTWHHRPSSTSKTMTCSKSTWSVTLSPSRGSTQVLPAMKREMERRRVSEMRRGRWRLYKFWMCNKHKMRCVK